MQSVLLSAILMQGGGNGIWGLNIFSDVVLVLIFLLYSPNIYKQNTQRLKRFWLLPQPSFSLFPGKLGFRLSLLMVLSMYAFRLPGLYFRANVLLYPPGTDSGTSANDPSHTTTSHMDFNSALFIINISTITIFCYAMYWSIGILLFHSDFTTCPDK